MTLKIIWLWGFNFVDLWVCIFPAPQNEQDVTKALLKLSLEDF